MWKTILKNEIDKEYFKKIETFLEKEENLGKVIYPEKRNRFLAFELTPYENIKVVIIGQDPYHGENEAHGLAFSTLSSKRPPSLSNIFSELSSDLGIDIPKTNDLSKWARQGVFLLNTVLTVEKDKANSHKNIGWQIFTQNILEELNKKDHVVYLLWGKQAQSYEKYLTNPTAYIIKEVHPSPLSAYRGFLGSKPFSKINRYLEESKVIPIDWSL